MSDANEPHERRNMTKEPQERNDMPKKTKTIGAKVQEKKSQQNKETPKKKLWNAIEENSDGFQVALNRLGMEYRFNKTIKDREIKYPGKKEWQRIQQNDEGWLRDKISKEFLFQTANSHRSAFFSREKWEAALSAAEQENQYDAFIDYLEKLPEADGTTDLGAWVQDIWQVTEDTEVMAGWVSQYFFLGLIQRAYKPGCKLDEIPIIIGEGDEGKSSIGPAILPPSVRDHGFNEGVVLNSETKVFSEAIIGKLLCELSEMQNVRGGNLARMKSNVTMTNDGTFRAAYAKKPFYSPRRAILFGTGNDRQVLPDEQNNRRFVVLEITGGRSLVGPVEDYMDRNRDLFFSEALRRYKSGSRANLPDDLKADQRRINESSRTGNELLEDYILELDWEVGETKSITEIKLGLEGKAGSFESNHRVKELTTALQNTGHVKKRKRNDGKQKTVWERSR